MAPNGRSSARPAQRIKPLLNLPLFRSSGPDSASKRWTPERPHTAYRRWTGNTRGFDFPRAAAPAAACVAGRSTGQHMLPQRLPVQKNGRLSWRHAWLAGPPANTCSQSNRKRIPQTKNLLVPSLLRRHACLTTPVVKRWLPQRLPVQPQKNPPIPPNPSCCRSRGGMRGWPVHRPTHVPQRSKQTATAPPTKPQKQKAHQYSSRRSSGVTAPNGRSRACERIPPSSFRTSFRIAE